MKSQIILIPAYAQDTQLIFYINELLLRDFSRFIIVDDGSSESCRPIFNEIEDRGFYVIHHPTNRGKGAAIKSGILHAERLYGSHISILTTPTGKPVGFTPQFITSDADGQHMPEDVERVTDEMELHPIRNSIRVYEPFLRFLSASLTGSFADLTLFSIIVLLCGASIAELILATIFARLVSGIINFEMNRHISFRSEQNARGELLRYGLLFISQMGISAAAVSALTLLIPAIPAKILIDTCLFFLSYMIQKKYVFRAGPSGNKRRPVIIPAHERSRV